jgi:ribonuclease III
VQKLRSLLEELPEELRQQVFTHASWTEKRSDSYSRLAFLGDSVLGLAVTTFLYPRLEAERFGAGRLTKIRAQAVSGPSCRAVAERLGVPERLKNAAPEGVGQSAVSLVETERVLASVIEAVIGACYLHNGYDRTAEAVVEAFMPEIERALEHPVDFKSTLQERLARRGQTVTYEVTAELGPPHDRTFEVVAMVEDEPVGRGSGRSKKHAEQDAAQIALEELESDEPMEAGRAQELEELEERPEG